jgi:hypothetical protein
VTSKWRDESSWSRGDVDRTPKTWVMDLFPGVRLTLTRHIHLDPDEWMVRLPWAEVVLKRGLTADMAKARAEMYVVAQLKAALRSLGEP